MPFVLYCFGKICVMGLPCRYLGLLMISQLGSSSLPKRVPSLARKGFQLTGQKWNSAASRGLLVSTKGGAWQFRDPQPDSLRSQCQAADGCSLQCAENFSFRLMRQS